MGDDDFDNYRVTRIENDVVEDLGTFDDLADALGTLSEVLDEIGGRAPIHDIDGDTVDIEPIATVATEDGPLTIARIGEKQSAGFHRSDETDEVSLVEGFASASEALLELICGRDEGDEGPES